MPERVIQFSMGIIDKWVSIKWDMEDDPVVGKVLRKERGFYILKSENNGEIPFVKSSLWSLEIIEKPDKNENFLMQKIVAPVWAWMNRHKMATIFWSGVLIDFWANWYSYAINHDWIVLQAFLGFFLPLMNFPFLVWFFDEKEHKERFKYCLCGAVSMTIGSTVMLLMVREGWIAGTAY